MSVADQLRAAIKNSELSGNMLAKQAGVSQPVLSRFLQGNDIKFSAAERLCSYFGLELRPADTLKAKDKVKAPAVPAIDWTKAGPKKKPRDEGRERRK